MAEKHTTPENPLGIWLTDASADVAASFVAAFINAENTVDADSVDFMFKGIEEITKVAPPNETADVIKALVVLAARAVKDAHPDGFPKK